jgi:Asp-tRNA(Asn)/Glu-tRNA(Gln) amidotransferase A subunit family amidase
MTVPCGFDNDGMPVGLQIMGRHGVDAEVIRLTQAFENETSFWMRRPTF